MKKITVLFALLTVCGLVLQWSGFLARTDFTLTNKQSDWTFSQHARKLNLIYFGYTSCPDACPMALSFSAKAWGLLSPEQQKNVAIIFISVDFEHDTSELVARYAEQFKVGVIGLTGSKKQLDIVAQLFHVAYETERDPRSKLGYAIGHTDKIFFVGRSGKVLEEIPGPRDHTSVLEAIKRNL